MSTRANAKRTRSGAFSFLSRRTARWGRFWKISDFAVILPTKRRPLIQSVTRCCAVGRIDKPLPGCYNETIKREREEPMDFKLDITLTDKDYFDYNVFWMLRSPCGKKRMIKYRAVFSLCNIFTPTPWWRIFCLPPALRQKRNTANF